MNKRYYEHTLSTTREFIEYLPFMNIEAWRKNENTGSFDQLTKGTLLTVEGYFKPEEWTDKDGVLHNRIVTVAVKFYPAVEKEEEAPAEPVKKQEKGKK